MTLLHANALSSSIGIAADAHTTTQTGSSIAVPTGARYALVIVNAGNFGASATMTVKVQTGQTSSEADLSGASFTQYTGSNENRIDVGVVRLHSNAGSIKIVGTYGGSGNAPLSATVVFLSHQYSEEADAFAFEVADTND